MNVEMARRMNVKNTEIMMRIIAVNTFLSWSFGLMPLERAKRINVCELVCLNEMGETWFDYYMAEWWFV